MNGKGLIISVGVGLGGLMIHGHGQIYRDIREVREDVGEVQQDISGLRERMARLEGLFEGHLTSEATQ